MSWCICFTPTRQSHYLQFKSSRSISLAHWLYVQSRHLFLATTCHRDEDSALSLPHAILSSRQGRWSESLCPSNLPQLLITLPPVRTACCA